MLAVAGTISPSGGRERSHDMRSARQRGREGGAHSTSRGGCAHDPECRYPARPALASKKWPIAAVAEVVDRTEGRRFFTASDVRVKPRSAPPTSSITVQGGPQQLTQQLRLSSLTIAQVTNVTWAKHSGTYVSAMPNRYADHPAFAPTLKFARPIRHTGETRLRGPSRLKRRGLYYSSAGSRQLSLYRALSDGGVARPRLQIWSSGKTKGRPESPASPALTRPDPQPCPVRFRYL